MTLKTVQEVANSTKSGRRRLQQDHGILLTSAGHGLRLHHHVTQLLQSKNLFSPLTHF